MWDKKILNNDYGRIKSGLHTFPNSQPHLLYPFIKDSHAGTINKLTHRLVLAFTCYLLFRKE